LSRLWNWEAITFTLHRELTVSTERIHQVPIQTVSGVFFIFDFKSVCKSVSDPNPDPGTPKFALEQGKNVDRKSLNVLCRGSRRHI
jgi:hypothetical protein